MRTACRDARWRQALACALVAACCAAGAAAAAPGEPPSRQQVQSAAERVRADPNLPGSKSEKTLRLRDRDKKPEDKKKDSDGLGWLRDFVTRVSEAARLLVWALGALALAWLVIRIRRWAQVRAGGGRHRMAPLPSHIGSLDIRPESLPDDVGSAVASLWQRGQRRPALSLLYRGALSRLVHLHAVPIRNASTEGECVALSESRLAPPSLDFFARLVAAWQLAAYGGRLPPTAGVLALCAEFDARLGAPAAAVAPGKAAP
ncbi:DUF4129 domain-containing protein [Polaromonas sp. JS666]|uniref:DUF4129 domain-containing protein n=1 Tax=Polaromonas sp. (strain JS666 / ATCC BAA-500) TaxID=296591 RepID=UPI000890E194|nr:DUF4129 domain-containing protein [Polaromonas sp. JS666]SDN34401.1 protein of unknown function [Polaromonas sp. JS666]